MLKKMSFLAACACIASGAYAIPEGWALQGYTLPDGYVDAEWIQPTSGGKQWILTDFTPAGNDSVEMRVEFPNLSVTKTIFCSRTDLNRNFFVVFLLNGKEFRMDRHTGKHNTGIFPSAGIPYDLVFDFGNRTIATNGVTTSAASLPSGDYVPGSPLTLFASHTAGAGVNSNSPMDNFADYKLFSFAVKSQSGAYKFALAPAIETATGKTGLYDVVGGKFYPNVSSTPFKSGIDGRDCVWTEEGDDKLKLSLASRYSLTDDDVARIVSSGRDFVFAGPGSLEIEKVLTGFSRNVIVEAGTLFVLAKDALGPNAGLVRILDGGCVALNARIAELVSNKTFEFEGCGPDGAGAFQVNADIWNGINNCIFRMTGDAKIKLALRMNLSKLLDTNGYNLEIDSNPWTGFNTVVTNSSTTASMIVNNGGKTMFEGAWVSPFRGGPGIYCMTNGSHWQAQFDVKDLYDWSLRFCDEAYVDSGKFWTADGWGNSVPPSPVFYCPVDFTGNTRITVNTNTATTLRGEFSGSGALTVDGGWLNLYGMSYTGTISAVAKTYQKYPWRAGIGLRQNSPVTASGFSFRNADLRIAAAYEHGLPKLAFDGGSNRVYGAIVPFEKRIDCAGIEISNNAEVVLESSLSATGAVEVSSGTLRLRVPEIATRAMGNAGLMSRMEYTENSVWWFANPSPADVETYTNRTCGVDTLTDGLVLKSSLSSTHRFHGYIWNRTGQNANWTFYANFNDSTYIWIDGINVLWDVHPYETTPPKPRFATVEVTPGPHEIFVIFMRGVNSSGTYQIPGLGYCPVGFDRLGRGMTTDLGSYYEQLIDPGDGSLLTVDTVEFTDGVPDKSMLVSSFTNLTMSADSTLDAGGNPISVGTFNGAPELIGVTGLSISERLVLPAADLVSRPLVIDGPVAFGENAVLDIDPEGIERISREERTRLSKGVEVLTATEMTGYPQLAPSARGSLFTARRSGNAIKLWYNARFLITIR